MTESYLDQLRRELYDDSTNPLLKIHGPREYYEAFGILEPLPATNEAAFIRFLLECVDRGEPMSKEERDAWFVPPKGCLL